MYSKFGLFRTIYFYNICCSQVYVRQHEKNVILPFFSRIAEKDYNPAKTGVTETTMYTKDYHYSDNPNITLVDCPGVGTENFPDVDTYGEKIKIDTFDAFIIITATRFTINAGRLAKKIRSMNKPFFFVRSKIDQDRQNEKRTRSEFNEVEMLEKIKAECSNNLYSKGAALEDNDIFLISNFFRYQWDFPRLTTAINRGLPFRKSECFLLSMIVLSEDILKRKVKVLRGRLFKIQSNVLQLGANPVE